MPTELDGFKKAAVIGGGLGTAIAYPQAKKLHSMGAEVHVITGFRDKSLVILEDELKAVDVYKRQPRSVVKTGKRARRTKLAGYIYSSIFK